MIKGNKTKKILALLIGLNFLVFLICGAAIYTMQNKEVSIQKSVNELSKYSVGQKETSYLKRTLDYLGEERAKLDLYFITSRDIVRFIEQIERLGVAAKAPVNISSVEVEGINALRVDFTAGGSFSQIFYLASLIEALPFEVVINKFNLSKESVKEVSSKDTNWSAEFSITLKGFLNK
jgi:hypothetical protein